MLGFCHSILEGVDIAMTQNYVLPIFSDTTFRNRQLLKDYKFAVFANLEAAFKLVNKEGDNQPVHKADEIFNPMSELRAGAAYKTEYDILKGAPFGLVISRPHRILLTRNAET